MRSLPQRSVVLACPDPDLRTSLSKTLSSMRWQVREAKGGAEALYLLEEQTSEALVLDSWLPDLDITTFTKQVAQFFPHVDLVHVHGTCEPGAHHSPRRNEILQALREATPPMANSSGLNGARRTECDSAGDQAGAADVSSETAVLGSQLDRERSAKRADMWSHGLIGQSEPMLELARLIRLVAPHDARVLIEGETGTGKELVAKALHAHSTRAQKPFVVLNCAAVPEALLEAELFGHTRGAFTGAVQARVGRIEAAHGGTLFLDEIGEMPLSLQAKLLRFLENGELQRVGDNESVRVNVRVLAATHQNVEEMAEHGRFRLDLFHRLSVFPIDVPSLRHRIEDIPLLCEHFLREQTKQSQPKTMSVAALRVLREHAWPGNVRELSHVLQRAVILSEGRQQLEISDILLKRKRQ